MTLEAPDRFGRGEQKLALPNQIQLCDKLAKELGVFSPSQSCGVVLDLFTESENADQHQAVRDTLIKSTDATVRAFAQMGDKKVPIEAAYDLGHAFSIRVSGITEEVLVKKALLNDPHLGGGMHNSLVDAAIITKTLYQLSGRNPETAPTIEYRYSATEQIREETIALIEKVGIPNLRAMPLKGQTRMSVFVRNPENPKDVISLCTAQGEIDEEQEKPSFEPNNRFVVVNNEPPTSQVFSNISRYKESPDMSVNVDVTWVVGSNQISDGLDKYNDFLEVCDVVVLNADELLQLVRSHGDYAIYNDEVLLELLEDTTEKDFEAYQNRRVVMQEQADQIYADYPEFSKGTRINMRTDLMPKKLPKQGELRLKAIQRCADLLHKKGFTVGTLYVTDGDQPTLVSERKSGTEKTQYALPILPHDKIDLVKDLIREFGLPAEEYSTGAGDSVSGTIIALRQITNRKIDSYTIGIIANYVSALLYHTPYSNLAKLEEMHPGITARLLTLALEKFPRTYGAVKNRDHLDPLSPPRTERSLSAILS